VCLLLTSPLDVVNVWLNECRLVSLAVQFHWLALEALAASVEPPLPRTAATVAQHEKLNARRTRRRRGIALVCSTYVVLFAYSTFYRHSYAFALFAIADGIGALADAERLPLRGGTIKIQ